VIPGQHTIKNKLLAAMSASDFALLAPHLTLVDLARGEMLVFPGEAIKYSWFVEDGIASLVTASHGGHEAEAGIIGHEGMVDVATVLGALESPLRCNMQIPGSAYRLPAHALAAAFQASPTLRSGLNRFAFTMVTQIAQTALANASFSIEQRLARWLLMCSDRLAGADIAITHEFLSLMLNVRRAGVTLAIQSLKSAGFVASQRGLITIVDRPGLEEFANDSYTRLP
jgi:CRP-like cAMP-binding protein